MKIHTKTSYIALIIFVILIAGGLPVHIFAADGATGETLQDIGSAIDLKVGNKSGDDITFGVILSALLPYLYVFGGMALFSMLIWGGFEMLAGAQDTKAQEAGKKRISAAAIGFVLLFVSYWLAQLLQILLGINILGK
ncbi:MAG: hypothetical protein UU93_C0035G0003 [Candidatus Amesbacteria bacterium GW2011_GWA2_42_12]|uniref:Uncharacterized protein n=1 Tax=Candidatus Amesbacteria bacterium GW2011_GWA2_42_12 TaxID=1618356 RepID=A0A0G0Y134_9BACT|nr:MAG: hypothetical protein UU93_C0035G0003 [Candidatus Amesbacteria bacterium GW2011_GWA2_42_12]